MAKQLNFEYNGENYTLEYTKRTVRDTEAAGFDIGKASEKPMSAALALFKGALRKNHPTISAAKAEALFDDVVDDYADWMQDLLTLYQDPYEGVGETKRTRNWTREEKA